MAQLSELELRNAKRQFDAYDLNGDGSISVAELSKILEAIGENYTEDKVSAAIAEIDADRNGSVEWNEFQAFMTALRGGKVSHGSKFREVHTKVGSARDSIMKAIKDAEPKKVQKKRHWAVNVNNSSTEGRYDGKTLIAGGPPPKRNVADLP